MAEKLLGLQPENYALAKKAASRYLERQNPKAALAKLQPCFEALPRDLETLQLLATTFEQLGQGGKAISVLKELVKVYEDQRQRPERNAAIQRILAIDPGDPIAGSLTTPLPVAQNPSLASRAKITDPSRPIKRDAAITFSELQIPAAIANQPSGSLMGDVAPDLTALDDEQRAAEVQRIITESDIFVKYGLTERASDHLRRVFEVDPDNLNARERLAAVLVQLGRKTEAVEQLGLLAEGLLLSDPTAAEKHLRRALDLEPSAIGAKAILESLQRGVSAGAGATGDEAESDLEELDMDELELELGAGDQPRPAAVGHPGGGGRGPVRRPERADGRAAERLRGLPHRRSPQCAHRDLAAADGGAPGSGRGPGGATATGKPRPRSSNPDSAGAARRWPRPPPPLARRPRRPASPSRRRRRRRRPRTSSPAAVPPCPGRGRTLI